MDPMLRKLSFRNVKRSARDYMVYFLTMTFITALMFAFNSLIFSDEIFKNLSNIDIMPAMIVLATFFIILIVAWLINYMVRFMLEKRGREFGIYLLIGMKKKEISRLYIRENMLLGLAAFLAGTCVGLLLQQVLMAILRSMLMMSYKLRLELDKRCLLMTISCYAGCYLLALLRCRRKFRKMNIHVLMNSQRQNEPIRESHENLKQYLLPLSLLFLAAFGCWLFFWNVWNTQTILMFIVGLVLVIYLFYIGLAARMICYVRKKGKHIYSGQNLFLLRQFSSKIKTMRFTMGTLTSLFSLAFLGSSIALMFNHYQTQILNTKFPFDVLVNSGNPYDSFREEEKLIEANTSVKEFYSYRIYQDGTNQVNIWLCTHLQTFEDIFKNRDGTPNLTKIENAAGQFYCRYDTYMGLSDYNHLRSMLGLEEIQLSDDSYLIHIKSRLENEINGISGDIVIGDPGDPLKYAGCKTESFCQDGHNGGDYMIIVPDHLLPNLIPYYSELAVSLHEKAPSDLMNTLNAQMTEWDQTERETFGRNTKNFCVGTDNIVVYSAKYLVRDNLIPEIKYALSSLIFPLFYVGLVFLCIALTVLSIQQLSDSAKYRYRYDVMQKIGLNQKEISSLILKQLFGYYLCPVLFASVISGIISIYLGVLFNTSTGINVPVFYYFGLSFALLFGIFGIYFITTYISFKRNVLCK